MTSFTNYERVGIQAGVLTINGNVLYREQNLAEEAKKVVDKIVQWLSNTNPWSNYQAACKSRQATTGEWFLKLADFDEWKSTQGSLIWVYGKPGCGKTILSSTVIEHLTTYCSSQRGSCRDVVVFFYFDYDDVAKQNATDLLSSLISQLCVQVTNLPQELVSLYESCSPTKRRATVDELVSILKAFAAMDDLGALFIVIDALDECPRYGQYDQRMELLKVIEEIKTLKAQLLVTSRPESDIKEMLTPLLRSPAIPIEGVQVDSDIALYIRGQLTADRQLKKWSDDVKEEIALALIKGADGMFQWVYCQLETLKQCYRLHSIRVALSDLPKTLDLTYERVLVNIPEDCRLLACRALIWLAFSKRPLNLEELAEAAVVDPDVEAPVERLRDPSDLYEILGSLLRTTSEKVGRFSEWFSFDSSRDSSETESNDSGPILDRVRRNGSKEKTVRIVKLAHYSVKEYLVSDRINLGKASTFRVSYNSANRQMTRTSLLYLFHYDSSAAKSGSEKDLSHFPLLRYACHFWYSHFKSIPKEYQMPIDALVLQFFLSPTALQSCLPIHRPDKDWLGPFVDFAWEIYTPLYHASDIGLTSIVKLLLDTGASVSAKTENGETALHRAAWRGHEDTVRLLLDHNAKIDEEDGNERTALHHASTNGHDAVVHVLLGHGASINTRSDRESPCNWTALTWAAHSGHEDVVRLLLESGQAQVNLKDQLGRTALHLVSDSYTVHKSVMRLLLEHNADANARNNKGETPLHLACERGHPSLVCLLLKHNAEVNARDQTGQTPLHRAAENPDEYYLAMELLLKHKADVNARDKKERTALFYASKQRHQSVVELLLEYQAEISSEILELGKQDQDSESGEEEMESEWRTAGTNMESIQEPSNSSEEDAE